MLLWGRAFPRCRSREVCSCWSEHLPHHLNKLKLNSVTDEHIKVHLGIKMFRSSRGKKKKKELNFLCRFQKCSVPFPTPTITASNSYIWEGKLPFYFLCVKHSQGKETAANERAVSSGLADKYSQQEGCFGTLEMSVDSTWKGEALMSL